MDDIYLRWIMFVITMGKKNVILQNNKKLVKMTLNDILKSYNLIGQSQNL
jgi:hypothetical protein